MSSEIIPAAQASFQGASCAFGVFDGVHAGHRYIIERAIDDARGLGGRSIIITFDEDPSEVLSPKAPDKLMSNEERIAALAELGADAVAVIPFDRVVASMAPEGFLGELFYRGAPSAIWVGEDFRFGRAASGTAAELEAWGASHGMTVEAIPLLEMDGAPVTSTRIRALLANGEVAKAARLLCHPPMLAGRVVAGRQVGRQMGICTANLAIGPNEALPEDGVYAAYAVVDGVRYKAAVSIGVPVTFADATESTIEAHILDFDEDIYGKELTLEFMERLRPMIKFDSPDELIAQISEDIERTRLLP